MKYIAVLFMCNDEHRAKFVASNFKKHNPDIQLIIYNGGSSANIKDLCDEYIEGPNLWHTKTSSPPGSFSYEWFEFLFNLHDRYDPDFLIFLETDVLTTRAIVNEPKYDISGACVSCGPIEAVTMYYYWGDHMKYMNREPLICDHRFHTGMGGTAFSRNFFEKARNNLLLVKECYDKLAFCCYQDLVITLLARFSGCTMGDWSECSDTRGTVRRKDNNWTYESLNMSCALIHNYKI